MGDFWSQVDVAISGHFARHVQSHKRLILKKSAQCYECYGKVFMRVGTRRREASTITLELQRRVRTVAKAGVTSAGSCSRLVRLLRPTNHFPARDGDHWADLRAPRRIYEAVRRPITLRPCLLGFKGFVALESAGVFLLRSRIYPAFRERELRKVSRDLQKQVVSCNT